MNIALITGWTTIVLCALDTLLTTVLSTSITFYMKNGFTKQLNPFSSKGRMFLFGLFLGYGYLATVAMLFIMFTNKALIINPRFMLICLVAMTMYNIVYNASGFFGQKFPALGNNQPSIKEFVGLVLSVQNEVVETVHDKDFPREDTKQIKARVFKEINKLLRDDTIENTFSLYDLITKIPEIEIIKKEISDNEKSLSDNKVYSIIVLDMRHEELHFFILDKEKDNVTEGKEDLFINGTPLEEYLDQKGIAISESQWIVFENEITIKIHHQNEVITETI